MMLSLTNKNQRGVALVVSLIMLLIMSLLAVSSMNTTVLEEKMAGNFKDRNMAFQSAEAALRAGERYLLDTDTKDLPFFDGTVTGFYATAGAGEKARWDNVNWKKDGGETITYASNLENIAEKPRYIIEELGPLKTPTGGDKITVQYYRITSYAVGGTDTAVVKLQSTYKRAQ